VGKGLLGLPGEGGQKVFGNLVLQWTFNEGRGKTQEGGVVRVSFLPSLPLALANTHSRGRNNCNPKPIGALRQRLFFFRRFCI
jgi:hypothetical protein